MLDLIQKDFYPVFTDRYAHLTHAFSKCNIEGHILEFGVFKGNTIRHIASMTDDIIYGFDSFKSLPEPWDQGGGRQIEYTERFKVDKIPEVPEHVNLVIGWFDTTVREWVLDYGNDIAFLHIDSDLYSSCKTILTELNHLIVPGTVIVFDEMFGYKNYKQHEYKAYLEWLNNSSREVELLGRTNKYACSMKVIK